MYVNLVFDLLRSLKIKFNNAFDKINCIERWSNFLYKSITIRRF